MTILKLMLLIITCQCVLIFDFCNGSEYFPREMKMQFVEKDTSQSAEWLDPHNLFNGRSLSYILTEDASLVGDSDSDGDATFQDPKVMLNQIQFSPDQTSINLPTKGPSSDEIISAHNYIFMKRWLKKFLNGIEKENNWDSRNLNFVELAVHGKIQNRLSRILEKSPLDIRALDVILEEAISGATVNSNEHFLMRSLFSLKSFFYWNQEMLAAFAVFVFLLLCFIYVYPKLFLFSIVVFISIFWHWMLLYQRNLAEKQYYIENLRHPNECSRSHQSLFESFTLYLGSLFSGSTDCKKYYEAVLINPAWEVNILLAVSNGLTALCCEPIKVICRTLRECGHTLFAGLSPLQSVFVCTLLFIIMLILFRYRFSLLWNCLTIEPSPVGFMSSTPARHPLTSSGSSVGFWGSIKQLLCSTICYCWGIRWQKETESEGSDLPKIESKKVDGHRTSSDCGDRKSVFRKEEDRSFIEQPSATVNPLELLISSMLPIQITQLEMSGKNWKRCKIGRRRIFKKRMSAVSSRN